ncbi:MAG: polynucleotide adenylyltransferase PcnB [Kiritimatiellae bacterium]|nr:polynucleotide adenylyltransferase PcnB [Kiritimatiellia bacterium]
MLAEENQARPVVLSRQEHCISRKNIERTALKVLYGLSDAGYKAYLVGGGVRDLLLGREPKDFDVGTDATPSEVKRVFRRNCFLIGHRFRLAHVNFGGTIIETSTFRAPPQPQPGQDEDDKMQWDDNTFGTPEEDANRRDFTVNGLFYDISTFSVIDYVGGLKDLKKKLIRSIGDPFVRFQEDPVRMMRAVKFASRLDFKIEEQTQQAILKHHADILKASPPRVHEEVFRLFSYGSSCKAFKLMWRLGLAGDLMPSLTAFIEESGGEESPVWNYLAALDADIESADVPNGVRAACLYYAYYKWRREQEIASAEAAAQNVPQEPGRRPRFRAPRIAAGRLAHEVMLIPARTIHLTKAEVQTAVLMLTSLDRFKDSPNLAGGRRFIMHRDFVDALAFRRIVLAAEGMPQDSLIPWMNAYKRMAREKGFYDD